MLESLLSNVVQFPMLRCLLKEAIWLFRIREEKKDWWKYTGMTIINITQNFIMNKERFTLKILPHFLVKNVTGIELGGIKNLNIDV